MIENLISILDGSTFVVSQPNGDIDAKPDQPHGLFFRDTRHLSHWTLTVNGIPMEVLSTDTVEYYFAQFYCYPPTGSIYKNPTLSVVRRRLVGDGFVENVIIANHGTMPEHVELKVEAGTDFADLFEVKDSLKKKGEYYRLVRDGCLVLGYRREDFVRETILRSTVPPASIEGNTAFFVFDLKPKDFWTTQLQVTPVSGDMVYRPKYSGAEEQPKPNLRTGLSEWLDMAPHLATDPDVVRRVYMRSLIDLAALQFFPVHQSAASLPAAGLPWFMAMFGRDSLLTSYQCLPFVPELAQTALRVLASRQGKVVDDFREEEPGKILHELRYGEMTHFRERPQSPYYGTADATPLFLVLLDEYERWSGDTQLVRELESAARLALEWIDRYGDRDGDGYIEYERKTEVGLENQCWKDSWNSIMFSDGTIAKPPIATCEIQGYAYDAKRRCARLAREVFKDEKLAERLDQEAAALKERFNRDFWIPDRKFFALALDGTKRKVDSLTSNIGHLLWSGIVDDDKIEHIVNHLMSRDLFSGWGVRTMARTEAGYNPIEYHNGTVWPHDNSLIAAGLRRCGYKKEATELISGIFMAAQYFDFRLPEVFAGYDRELTQFPVRYPTASSPQAWAAGSAMLGLSVMLGLEPGKTSLSKDPVLPDWIGNVSLTGIPGRWGQATVAAERKGALTWEQVIDRELKRRVSISTRDPFKYPFKAA